MMTEFTVQQLRMQFESLKSSRQSLDTLWANVFQLTKPNRALSTYLRGGGSLSGSQNPYQNVGFVQSLHNNRGSTNSAILSSYLHSSLTNPHDKWFSLQPKEDFFLREKLTDQDLQTLQGLDYLTRQAHIEYQSSNFHQVMYPFYRSLVDIGNGCITIQEQKEQGSPIMIFGNRSMFNIWFQENAYGQPDTVFCMYNWTARQIASFFKLRDAAEIEAKAGKEVLRDIERNAPQTHTFIHAVYPSDLTDPQDKKYDSRYFMFSSVSEEKNGVQQFLKEDKLKHQPYIVSRIRKEDGDVYGNGFSMEAFSQLVQLQIVTRSNTIGAQKNIEPALNAPSSRIRRSYSTNPNHLNPVDNINGNIVQVTPTMGQINLQGPAIVKQQLEQDIDRIYMVDKIALESVGYNRTGAEVQKRSGEEVKLLSPFIGSLESEFLKPLVKITLRFLSLNAPEKTQTVIKELDKLHVSIKYISDIAKAQIKSSANGMVELFGILSNMAQVKPEVLDLIDWRKYSMRLVMLFGGPFDTLKSVQEIEEQDQQQQAAQQEAAQLEKGEKALGAAKTLETLNKSQLNKQGGK